MAVNAAAAAGRLVTEGAYVPDQEERERDLLIWAASCFGTGEGYPSHHRGYQREYGFRRHSGYTGEAAYVVY